MHRFTSTQSINFQIDGQETTTELPNIVDNVVRNENEIVKFSPPISTSIIDDSISDIESSSYASYIVPLKIILPVEHIHKTKNNDTFERFNYILLKVDDASYHEHIYSDNSDFLLPVERNTTSPTAKPVFDIENNTETTTNTPNIINSDTREIISEPIQRDDSDTVLVDSQGYRYELGKHYKIMDDQGTSVVEFDEIAMVREKMTNKSHNQISKRILVNDDDETIKTTTESQKNNLHSELYEGHYAKIFQWLHYHL